MLDYFNKIRDKIAQERTKANLNHHELANELNKFIEIKFPDLEAKEKEKLKFKYYTTQRFEKDHNFLHSKKFIIVLLYFFHEHGISPSWFLTEALSVKKYAIENNSIGYDENANNSEEKERQLKDFLLNEVFSKVVEISNS